MAKLSGTLTALFLVMVCLPGRTFVDVALAAGAEGVKSENNGCSAVKLVWGTKRWPSPQSFPSSAIPGTVLTWNL